MTATFLGDAPRVVVHDGWVEVSGRPYDVRPRMTVETRVEQPPLRLHLGLFCLAVVLVPVALVLVPASPASLSWLVGLPMALSGVMLFRLMTLSERYAVLLRCEAGERRIYASPNALHSAHVASLVTVALSSPQSPGVSTR